MSGDLKIVFAGPAGVGKSAAIHSVGDGRINSTEVNGLGGQRPVTAALDYAEVIVERSRRLRLFGLPGEARFDHMHPIVSRGATGFVVLSDNSAADPVADCIATIERCRGVDAGAAIVVGITRSEIYAEPGVGDYYDAFTARDLSIPLLVTDPRQRDDLLGLLDLLLMQIDDASDFDEVAGRLQ